MTATDALPPEARHGLSETPGDPIVLVFSKDRPMQLDATLRSLSAMCSDLASATIQVLYRATSPRVAAAYGVVQAEVPGLQLVKEVDFKKDVLRLLGMSRHVLFVVDDTLFVRPFSLKDVAGSLERQGRLLGFSLRLGANTDYCYPADRRQRVPRFDRQSDGSLTFDWTEAEYDFAYPLELSSSVYRTEDLLPIIEGLSFRNPNTLESALSQSAGRFAKGRPALACFETSVAFSVPVNMVQSEWANRSGRDEALSLEALLRRYELGERIATECFSGFVANACHQELPLPFESDPSLPVVSVVIPCYRQAEYLPDAVRSVASQTFDRWEVVVVDDGSPDDTAEVASRLQQEVGPRLKIVRQANAGPSAARNSGVIASRGRYILPLDADDVLEPMMLARCVEILDAEPGIAIAYPDTQLFGASDQRWVAGPWDLERLCWSNEVSYCALYRREVWYSVGGYDLGMAIGYEDWDFWIAASIHGYRGRRIPEPLFRYRVRPGTRASTALKHHRMLVAQIRRNHPAHFRVHQRVLRRIRFEPESLPKAVASKLLRRGLD